MNFSKYVMPTSNKTSVDTTVIKSVKAGIPAALVAKV